MKRSVQMRARLEGESAKTPALPIYMVVCVVKQFCNDAPEARSKQAHERLVRRLDLGLHAATDGTQHVLSWQHKAASQDLGA